MTGNLAPQDEHNRLAEPVVQYRSAEAFKRDIADAQVELLDTGHFALETHSAEVAVIISEFLQQKLDVTPGAFSGGRQIE